MNLIICFKVFLLSSGGGGVHFIEEVTTFREYILYSTLYWTLNVWNQLSASVGVIGWEELSLNFLVVLL